MCFGFFFFLFSSLQTSEFIFFFFELTTKRFPSFFSFFFTVSYVLALVSFLCMCGGVCASFFLSLIPFLVFRLCFFFSPSFSFSIARVFKRVNLYLLLLFRSKKIKKREYPQAL